MSAQEQVASIVETSEIQEAMRADAAQLLDVPIEAIADWRINRIREDGAIDAYVPIQHVDVTGVPTDPRNVERLVRLFEERAEEVGGTGQRDPVVIGHVPGEAFFILDGFHRHETQNTRGVPILHATIEPNLTYEQVVKRRLEYANTHPEIEFARQVEWVQSLWERTPWCKSVPNVLTAFRAFHDDYEIEKSDDTTLLNSLSDEAYEGISGWVKLQCEEWGYSPAEIRGNLTSVESFSPDLMHFLWHNKGRTPIGRINVHHVQAITATYPGEFDMQKAVVSLVVAHGLNPKQTEAMIVQLEDSGPTYDFDIIKIAQNIDFRTLKARAKQPGKKKRLGGWAQSEKSLDGQSVSEALRTFREMLPDIQAEALNSQLSNQDIENALEIGLILAETLGQLSLKEAAEPV